MPWYSSSCELLGCRNATRTSWALPARCIPPPRPSNVKARSLHNLGFQNQEFVTMQQPNRPGTVSLMWFRRDLRVFDNEALMAAGANCHELVPFYCLDPSQFRPRRPDGLQVPKLGPHRCRFLLEALQALEQQLQQKGSGLLFSVEHPASAVTRLVAAVAQNTEVKHLSLHLHLDVLPESVEQEDRVAQAFTNAAAAAGVSYSIHQYWDLTLYHPDDLPYQRFGAKKKDGSFGGRINQDLTRYAVLPAVMTEFRKVVQSAATVRALLPAPEHLPPLPPCLGPTNTNCRSSAFGNSTDTAVHKQDPDNLPGTPIPVSVAAVYAAASASDMLQGLQDLTGMQYTNLPAAGSGQFDSRSAFQLTAGTEAALRRLRYFLWGHPDGPQAGPPTEPPALHYFTNTRAQAFGADNSTKLSPYVALGCISPRQLYHEVMSVKAAAQQLDSPVMDCDWFIMHLCIRDFWIFTALKEGQKMLGPEGIKGQLVPWGQDKELFKRWARGETGFPFVDACMMELATTGFMSNRGRQNVASFLTKDLLQDWRWGAELFECLLLDHDVAVNYCNWNYFAGIGNDPRNRHFKTVTQGMQYDEQAKLITTWLPPLHDLPTKYKHAPFLMTTAEAEQHSFQLGRTYPTPVVDPATQIGTGPKAKGTGLNTAKSTASKVKTT